MADLTARLQALQDRFTASEQAWARVKDALSERVVRAEVRRPSCAAAASVGKRAPR